MIPLFSDTWLPIDNSQRRKMLEPNGLICVTGFFCSFEDGQSPNGKETVCVFL